MVFIPWDTDWMNLGLEKIAYIGYLIGDYSVIFLVTEYGFNLSWEWKRMALDLSINGIWG